MKIKPITLPPGYIDSPVAPQQFDALITAVLAVPHSAIMEREREYRKAIEADPHRRGPKRKVKPSVS